MSSVAARLELLCEVNRRLAAFASLDALLRYATERTRELFEAEGCAILLVDEATQEFRFTQTAASHTSDERLRDVRFPVTKGVAGWVRQHGSGVAVDDVQHDPRFYGGVDATTGSKTRTLLAAPLRTASGIIGVVEVMNPRAVADGDVAFLEALGGEIGVAHERAAASSALRAEANGLRRVARLGGIAAVALGVGLVGLGVVVHAARALPARELVTEPGMLLGVAVAVAGVALVGAVRRVPTAA